jgi:hypothetical protein
MAQQIRSRGESRDMPHSIKFWGHEKNAAPWRHNHIINR